MEIYYMPCFGMGHGFSGGRPRSREVVPQTGGGVEPGLELLEAGSGTLLAHLAGQTGKVSGNYLESLAVQERE
jgi:hypothetical protein